MGCGDDGAASAPSTGADQRFSFTGDDGVTIDLDGVPQKLAAWVTAASSLADFGNTVDGVWGPPDLARGVDLGGTASGDDFVVNIEAMAAARPVLIIGTLWMGDNSLPQAEELDNVRAIAPMVRLEGNGPSITGMIEAHERLAVALGADPDDPEIAAARNAFHARTELEAAAQAKPGLKVHSLSLMADAVYVGYLDQAVLRDFVELGLDVYDNVDDDPAWDNGLSWELVPELPADLIIWDQRSQFVTPDDLAANPTWEALPAVQAGQVTPLRLRPDLQVPGHGRPLPLRRRRRPRRSDRRRLNTLRVGRARRTPTQPEAGFVLLFGH